MHNVNHNGTQAKIIRHLASEAATLNFAGELAAIMQPGLRIYFYGDLGAGKTTFVRGILRGMGYTGKVKSPTYTLVELYMISSLYLYHFDLYRFDDPNEWFDAGFRDHFSEHSICLVEWPEKAASLLPMADLQVHLHITDDGRQVELVANTARGELCIHALRT